MPVRGLLLDLEGVLYQAGQPISGASDAVRQLAEAGLQIRYLTNTTTQPRRVIVERLRALGFDVEVAHVFTPAAAACRLMARSGVQRVHLAAPSTLGEDFSDFALVEERPDAVVMGDLYKDFTWDRLNDLFGMLRAGARLIALHRNRYCRRAEGITLDLGPFVAALEYACDIQADVLGKPAEAFFALALDHMGLSAPDVVMVGDDLEIDVGGAQHAGLRAIQVETGKYTERDRSHASVHPDLRIPSIAALPAALKTL
jgi:phospholysine phosphohistidine inorganic pyrophosphate phosphatase